MMAGLQVSYGNENGGNRGSSGDGGGKGGESRVGGSDILVIKLF